MTPEIVDRGTAAVAPPDRDAVADCFRFRNKVGLDAALEALTEAWRSKRLTQSYCQEATPTAGSIAEKTEAMVRLALANSRMKDFFDIHRLAATRTFDGETMRLAVAATFTRRDIEIPGERPLALTSEFGDDAQATPLRGSRA